MDPDRYLDYLDKEMTIMGILSAFCIGVPALLFERLLSAEKDSVVGSYVSTVLTQGPLYLLLGSLLCLGGAVMFYRQRSRLAWFYGQISLESTVPQYTGRPIREWVIEADSWKSWYPYNSAFWIMACAVVEFALSILSAMIHEIHDDMTCFSIIPVVATFFWLMWVWRNSRKFTFEEKLPYSRIK